MLTFEMEAYSWEVPSQDPLTKKPKGKFEVKKICILKAGLFCTPLLERVKEVLRDSADTLGN